jgi:hypothetical protein
MDDFYLYLYCGDSLATHVNNHAGDFLVDLPKSYRIQGQWECALTEITFVSQLERLTQRIYVCCDLADQSYVKETSLPVLRSIDVDADEKVDLIFNPPHYLKVNRQDLSRIQIFIRDDELNPCRFKIDRLYCTLHFRRRWGA